MPIAPVGDTLQKLESELLFLHRWDGRHFFSTEPNLNNLIVQAEESVDEQELEAELRRWVEKYTGEAIKGKVWPRGPGRA